MEKCKHAIIFQDITIQDLNSGWVLLHAGATWKSHHSVVGSGQGGFLSGLVLPLWFWNWNWVNGLQASRFRLMYHSTNIRNTLTYITTHSWVFILLWWISMHIAYISSHNSKEFINVKLCSVFFSNIFKKFHIAVTITISSPVLPSHRHMLTSSWTRCPWTGGSGNFYILRCFLCNAFFLINWQRNWWNQV